MVLCRRRPEPQTARPWARNRPRRRSSLHARAYPPAGRGFRQRVFYVAARRICVLDESDLQRMTPEERARLARALASLNAQSLAPTPLSQRRRQLLIAACLAGVVLLSVWVAVLEVKLPRDYRAGGWRAAWVWFDIALDWATRGFMVSVLSAALVELPLAVVALIGARRLLRLTIGRLELLAGSPGP